MKKLVEMKRNTGQEGRTVSSSLEADFHRTRFRKRATGPVHEQQIFAIGTNDWPAEHLAPRKEVLSIGGVILARRLHPGARKSLQEYLECKGGSDEVRGVSPINTTEDRRLWLKAGIQKSGTLVPVNMATTASFRVARYEVNSTSPCINRRLDIFS